MDAAVGAAIDAIASSFGLNRTDRSDTSQVDKYDDYQDGRFEDDGLLSWLLVIRRDRNWLVSVTYKRLIELARHHSSGGIKLQYHARDNRSLRTPALGSGVFLHLSHCVETNSLDHLENLRKL